MRKRSGIFAVVVVGMLGAVGGLGAGVSGCGASSSGAYASPSGDGGVEPTSDAAIPPLDGTIGADAGNPPGDSGSSSDAPRPPGDSGLEDAPGVGPTRILAIHASANLYDYRLCFGAGGGANVLPLPAYPDDPAAPMPETNYPGVPVGGAALLPAITFGYAPVTPFVVRAQVLEKLGYVSTNPNEPTCDALICQGSSTCLLKNYDYFELPPVVIPPLGGGLALAIEGCVPFGVVPGSSAQCGDSYDGGAIGNLSAEVAPLAPSGAGVWTVQVAQLSPSFAAEMAAGDAGAPALAYVDPATDASVPLSPSPLSGGFLPLVTLPLGDAGVLSAYLALAPGSAPALTESLAAIQFFQSPSSNPTTYFEAPSTYLVAIVGDATDAAAPASLPDGAPNPAFDGHGLHVIAYPERGN